MEVKLKRDMQVEIAAAVSLVAGNLYNKLPRRRVDAFAEELEKAIINKFQGHWYPDNPSKGAAYRCINVSGDKVDPVIIYSVISSGLDVDEVNSYLPKDLIIWIDPGEVSFSIGEKGQVKYLYSERRQSCSNDEPASQPLSYGSSTVASSSASLSPVNIMEDITSNLTTSFGNFNLLPGGAGSSNVLPSNGWGVNPSPTPWQNPPSNNSSWISASTQKPAPVSPWNTAVSVNALSSQPHAFPVGTSVRNPSTNNKTMTAAMFAQTKFGSTKLKTQTKRSNRLSPTENFSRVVPGQPSFPVGTRPVVMTMNQSLNDRMQIHLQNTNNSDFQNDPFKTGTSGIRHERFNTTAVVSPGFNGNLERFSPFTLGSLTGLSSSASEDWIDLTDLGVHPSGNQLLAT